MDFYPNYLQHYGVLGMKWGVRHDRKRSGSAKKRASSASKSKTVEQQKSEVLKSRSAKALYKNADLFTNDELRRAYERLNLERNIKNIADQEVSAGQKTVRSVGKTLASSAAAATSVITLWNAFANTYDMVTKTDKFQPIGQKKKKSN